MNNEAAALVSFRKATNNSAASVVTLDMKAIWNGTTIAESNDTVVIEGNHYFPRESVKKEYLRESTTHTTCAWKGVASYYSLEVDGKTNVDAAWYYAEPSAPARVILNRIAFWRGVEVVN